MKLRLAAPQYVIDIDPLAGELGYVRAHNGEIRIGAMTRHRDLLESPLLNELLAIFTDAERVIADPVVRNRGTIGGALCQADPSEDLSAVCAAVDARLVISGAERRARDRHGRVPSRAVRDRGRAGGDAGRDPRARPAARGQRLREAGPARRRLGGRRRRAPRSRWPRRDDRQCPRRAGRRRRRHRLAGHAERPRAVGGDVRRSGGAGRRRVRSGDRPARLEGVQTTRRRRPHGARAHARSREGAGTREEEG